ncbi:MAG: ATP-binding cassette domain-containing protein [Bdellovibrionales bacterium]
MGDVVRSSELRMAYLQQDSQWKMNQPLEDLVSEAPTPPWKCEMIAESLGINAEMFRQPINELSGGYRMRCQLVHLLVQQPNLLLLDEPTNYLDLETLLVLEKSLQEFEGAFFTVSHDREFFKENDTLHFRN